MSDAHACRAYGHADCCGCGNDIDLSGQLHTVRFVIGNEELFFCFCAGCQDSLNRHDRAAQVAAIEQPMHAMIAAMPERTGHAVLSRIALREHEYDAVKAYEIGSTMPECVVRSIIAGSTEIPFLSDVLDGLAEGDGNA